MTNKKRRLGDLFVISSSKRVLEKDWKTEGIPFYRAREIVSIKNNKNLKNPIYISEDKYNELKKTNGIPMIGDILVTAVGTIGVTYIVETQPFYFKDGNLIWFKINNSINSKYLSYIFDTNIIKDQIKINQMGTTVDTFTIITAKKIIIDIENREFQNKIANYLDEKTSSIDNSIESLKLQKERLIEQKKAIIHKAVTKGLDNSVEMKDSGIEWIGEIPKHWKINKVKNIFQIGRGRVISKEEIMSDGVYPVYSSQTKNNGVMGTLKTYDFEGDYLTWTTDGVNAGTVFERHGKFNCTNVCGTLKLLKKMDLSFFNYIIGIIAKNNKRDDINGGKLMNNEMANLFIYYPENIIEQNKISNYLNKKTLKIEEAVNEVEKQIKLLEEYKKTLINDVVTGKVKVF